MCRARGKRCAGRRPRAHCGGQNEPAGSGRQHGAHCHASHIPAMISSRCSVASIMRAPVAALLAALVTLSSLRSRLVAWLFRRLLVAWACCRIHQMQYMRCACTCWCIVLQRVSCCALRCPLDKWQISVYRGHAQAARTSLPCRPSLSWHQESQLQRWWILVRLSIALLADLCTSPFSQGILCSHKLSMLARA